MRGMLQSFGVLTALSLAVAPAAFAQGAAPAPGPEHKKLGFFVGKWNVEGELKAGPMGPGGKYTASDTCEWFEGGFSVICRSEGKMPTGPAKSIGILSYSSEEKVYTYYGTDNSGMTMASVPKGTRTGDTWTYNDEGLMGGQKVKSRVVIKEVSPKEYTFRMEFAGPDGKWMPVMEAKNTKAQ
jgi:Protein of unknown function (DUF1579)